MGEACDPAWVKAGSGPRPENCDVVTLGFVACQSTFHSSCLPVPLSSLLWPPVMPPGGPVLPAGHPCHTAGPPSVLPAGPPLSFPPVVSGNPVFFSSVPSFV